MDNAVETLLRMLDEGFERKAWHGPNLRGSLRGLSAQDAAWRPERGRHNIWEIAVHAAYWKYTVRRRLLGEKRGSFPLAGSNWFTRPVSGISDDQQWKADIALLVSTHRSLREAIAHLKISELSKPASGGSTSVLSLVTGITFHDIYHAGQIQLLKRLRAGEPT